MRKGIALFIPESPGESAALSTQVPVCAVAKKESSACSARQPQSGACVALSTICQKKKTVTRRRENKKRRAEPKSHPRRLNASLRAQQSTSLNDLDGNRAQQTKKKEHKRGARTGETAYPPRERPKNFVRACLSRM